MPVIEVLPVDSDREFNLIFDIRRIVFQGEQNVSDEDEFDGHDHISHHYIALRDGKPCGTARWRVTPAGNIKLERFAVLQEFRGLGIGRKLVEKILTEVPKTLKVYLHAQSQVVSFYEKFGFLAEGPEFDEAEIMHRRMVFQKN